MRKLIHTGLYMVLLVFMGSCGSGDSYLQQLEMLDPSDVNQAHRIRMGYSVYVMEDMGDMASSIRVVERLITLHAFTEARYCIDHLLEKDIQTRELYYLRAVCYRNQEHFDLALQDVEKGLSLGGNNAKLENEKKIIMNQFVFWNKIRRSDSILAQGFDPEEILDRASNLLSLRMFDAAIYDTDQLLKRDSTNQNAMYLKAMSLLYGRDYEKSTTVFRGLLEISQGSASYADYVRYAGLSEELQQLSTAIKNDPGNVSNYVEISRKLAVIGEYERALTLLDQGLHYQKNDASLLQSKLLVYIQMGDMGNAKRTAQYIEALGIRIDPRLRSLIH